jgi:hypothetical protein
MKRGTRLPPSVNTVGQLIYSDEIKDLVDVYCQDFINEAYGLIMVHVDNDGVVQTAVGGNLGDLTALGALDLAKQHILARGVKQ